MTPVPYSIIVPVWGRTHVARFLDWALPTWLSPQNLPELVKRGPVGLILLTSRKDFEAIESSPMVALLRSHCEVKLIEIDDLIPGGIATVTLTLAFTRGVKVALAEGQHRRLIFLNGDFLLTDGSIRSIANRFDAGQELLLCSSIRVREELAGHDFIRMRRSDGVMILPGREAVKTALGALHPTVLACRVDQPLLSSAHPNQFFWRPDSSTLILRAFLLFPLAVAPTRVPGPADTYCDYGWITTMVDGPSVNIVDNADELFVVELAPTSQEIDFVKSGVTTAADCALRMSQWMTDFSRAQAEIPILFKAEDGSSAAIAEVVASSKRYIDKVQQNFGPLNPVRNHPYWLAGVASYIRNRRSLGIDLVPEEISLKDGALPPPNVALRSSLRGFARQLLMGIPGRRWPWHPFWRADQVIGRFGRLRAVGRTAILGQLAIENCPDGAPVEVVEFNNAEAAVDALMRLSEMVKPEQRAYLVVSHDVQLASGKLSTRERIAALTAIERQFRILSITSLVNRIEADAAARHRLLALEVHLANPLRALRMFLASAFSVAQVLLSNLFGLGSKEPASESAVLLLELSRTVSN